MSELAKAYFRLYYAQRPYLWAKPTVENIFADSAESAWNITLELIEISSCLEELKHVATTFFKPFCEKHLPSFFERIKSEAIKNDRMLYVMRYAMISPDQPLYDQYNAFVVEQLLYRDPKLAMDLPEMANDGR